MFMTEDEVKDFINKYIKKEDLFLAADDRLLVNLEASKRISAEFGVELVEGAVFAVSEIIPFLIKKEDMRRAAAASHIKQGPVSEEAKNNKEIPSNSTAQILEIIKKYDRNDTYIIAEAILKELPKLADNQIKEGIKYAEKVGLIDSARILEATIRDSSNKRVFFNNVLELKKKNNDQEFVDLVVKDMLNNYNSSILRFGWIVTTLRSPELGLDEDTINKCISEFYSNKKEDLIVRYTNTKLSTDEIVQDILRNYADLNISYVLESLMMVKVPDLDIDLITYLLYMNEDSKSVSNIIMKPGLNSKEIAEELKELKIEYPVWCIKNTLDAIKKTGAKLPYKEIFEFYIDSAIQEPEPNFQDLDDEDKKALGITATRKIETLPDLDGENLGKNLPVPFIPIQSEDNNEKSGKRHKIISRRKENKSLEKKKTIVTVLAAAGAISTAIFVQLYNIDAISAATNCATAMEPIFAKISGIGTILPSKVEFAAILASVATTITASVSYFIFKNKEKRTKEIPQVVEEDIIDIEVEDVEVISSVEDKDETTHRKGR